VFGDEGAALRERVGSMLSGTPKIVVNLGSVEHIDSGGIGVLVGLFVSARINVRDTGNTRRIDSQIRPIEMLAKSAAGDERQKNRGRNGKRRALSFHRLAHWRLLAFEIQPVL
jgi:hypothetical protein